jgi:uncharacterized protein
MTDPVPVLVRNDELHRYELHVGESVAAFAEFRVRLGYLVFTHTETDAAFEGRGYASALAKGALDDVRQRGQRLRADCPFIASYIKRHPEYEDLLVAA